MPLREPLEEQTPGREQVLAVAAPALLEADQVRQSRLAATSRSAASGTNSLDASSQLRARGLGASSSSVIPARMRTISASAQ